MGQQTYQRETMLFFSRGSSMFQLNMAHSIAIISIIESNPGGWWRSDWRSEWPSDRVEELCQLLIRHHFQLPKWQLRQGRNQETGSTSGVEAVPIRRK